MGLAEMMRKAAPMIQMATNTGEESNLELLRRMAQSKIKTPVIITPPVDPGFSPPRSGLVPENPDIGFERPAPMFPETPALGKATQEPGKLLPYVAPTSTAPDMSRGDLDPAAVEAILARMRPDPNAPVTTTSEMAGNLIMRPMEEKQPVDFGQRDVEGLVFDEHGRPLKPQYLDPHSAGARKGREEYISALDTYKPENHNSRIKSALITGGRAALLGLRHGPGGAVGGFVTGLGIGALDPSTDERYAKQRDLGEARSEQGRDFQYRKAESDLLNEQSEREWRRAQAQRALNPQYKPDVITLGNGDIVSVEDGVAKPITGVGGKPLKGKVNATYEWRNDSFTGKAELWERHPGETDKKVIGASDANRDLIKSAQGWVKPGTALIASATAENRDFNRDRKTTEDAQRTTERTEDKTTRADERTQARRERAAAIVARLDTARKAWIDYDAQAKTQPNYKTHFETLRDKAGAEAAGAASELNAGFSDFYEAGVGEAGLAYYKEKPGATPQLQPPVQGKPGKIQSGEDPQVRSYANEFFRGDYQAAAEAIRKQKRQ